MAATRGGEVSGLRALLRDDRFWKIAFQVLTAFGVVVLFWYFANNVNQNMAQKGTVFGFSFLNNPAGFAIGESLIDYQAQDPYFKVLIVGFLNSLRVMIVGIILATLVGITAGVASFSKNWLVYKLSRAYVGLVRNVPLLLQLFTWYLAVYGLLPRPQNQLNVGNVILMSKKGIYLPWPTNTAAAWSGLVVILLAAIAAFFIWRWRIRLRVNQGATGQPQLIALIAIGVAALLIFLFGLGWSAPEALERGRAVGGLRLSKEYASIVTGLVFYTGAFIAEIVRAGIQSVSKGQWEAARSMGLSPGLCMRLVVFPQALRVIIPPLNSEYQNLAKNSSLAIAIGYPDLYSVSITSLNQTGRPIEVFILLMAAFLVINLLISTGMNTLNRAVQFKER